MTHLLEIDHLSVDLVVRRRRQMVLQDVSLTLERAEVVALVGESGSGKSMTARSVMNLLPQGGTMSGAISFDGRPLLAGKARDWRDFRSTHAAMIFQDPRAAINPVHRIDDFLTEALVHNHSMPRDEANERATALLELVGIDDAKRRMRQYPHELSGGMLQRVMIASVLLVGPELILADEPTTALDVTTQADVLAILDDLRRQREMAMLFITHDLELAAAISNRIAVMYAGHIVEISTPDQLHARPMHPYTAALLQSRPLLRERMRRLPQIAGRPLSAFEAPPGCPFQDRCAYVQPQCTTTMPPVEEVNGSVVRCIRARELNLVSMPSPDATTSDTRLLGRSATPTDAWDAR
jgi:oligopeptide/dipeptide ABC transporter ATP-binding protein